MIELIVFWGVAYAIATLIAYIVMWVLGDIGCDNWGDGCIAVFWPIVFVVIVVWIFRKIKKMIRNWI